MANTRTVLLWYNNGVERIYFTVNPAEITVTRPNENRVFSLAMGGSASAWGGRGLRQVKLTTFLPAELSPFFNGVSPETVLTNLKAWQDSGGPVRLIISGSDINDAFLIEDVSETLREGDGDVGLSLLLREYRFKSELAALAGKLGGSAVSTAQAGRTDERTAAKTWTVRRGDTLWGIASRVFGDGTKWKSIAEKNGVSDPEKLQIGKVLTL